MANKKLQGAKCFLMAQAPWYGHAAAAMQWRSTVEVDSMAVRVIPGGRVECVYNPQYLATHSTIEVAVVIQHEIEHVVRRHCVRAVHRDAYLWNLACDMCVNGPKIAPRIGLADPVTQSTVIPERDSCIWIPPDWPARETAEQYYQKLQQKPNVVSSFQGTRSLDDHRLWQNRCVSPQDEMGASGDLVKSASRTGCEIPNHLRNEVANIEPPRICWYQQLRRIVGSVLSHRKTNWSRPSRRSDLFGIPGRKPYRRSRVSVVVDVSGSVSQRDLQSFFSEIDAICTRSSINIVLWDHQWQGFIPHYRRGDWQTINLNGGGGTDMAAPVRWLTENGHAGGCVIVFTDGYCNWPPPGRFTFIAVVSSPRQSICEPKWGTTLYLQDR